MDNYTNKKASPVRGVKVRTLNVVMILVSFTLYVLLLLVTFGTAKNYDSTVNATSQYVHCRENASQVSDASDYLTEQVRLFTVTLDSTHAKNYFEEIQITRRRENALNELNDLATPQALSYLESALEFSNQLMERELYAMRLTAEANHIPPISLDKQVEDVQLHKEHLDLSPQEKDALAKEMVFGSEYQSQKKLIASNVNSFLTDVLRSTLDDQESGIAALNISIFLERVLFSVLFLQNILVFGVISFLIVKPLQVYVNCIKEEKRMEITGAYEFKYLALTYNDIYELNAANEVMLRHQAEHDPLTGIMNRGAFDHVRQLLKIKSKPVALLMMDIDHFKEINDSYGHETGDRLLKRVARLLEEGFRSTDFIARVGGDEFAVILTDMENNQKTAMEQKVQAINSLLLHPKDNLPPASVSAGAAFSEHGFSDELYREADAALYQVKKNGRCGCRIFQPGTPPAEQEEAQN